MYKSFFLYSIKKEHKKKESRMLFVKHAAFLVSTGHKACIKKVSFTETMKKGKWRQL